MTVETAAQLARKPKSYGLGEQTEFALRYPAFVGIEDGEVFAGAGVYPHLDGKWRAWVVIPAIGFRRLRWVQKEMREFLASFDRPLRATIEMHDGAGYVFARMLGFTETLRIEHNAGEYFLLLERNP